MNAPTLPLRAVNAISVTTASRRLKITQLHPCSSCRRRILLSPTAARMKKKRVHCMNPTPSGRIAALRSLMKYVNDASIPKTQTGVIVSIT